MHFRKMVQGDLDQIAVIEQEYFSPWTPAQVAEEFVCSGSIPLVAEDSEGHDCGWCCARVIGPEAELLKIAVQPDKRGAGIAGALLHHLENILTDRRVETLFLEVRSQNSAALRLYLKHGFAEVGVRSGYYSNPQDNALIFRKELLYSEG